MASPRFILAFLFTICLSCVSFLEPWYQKWSGAENQSEDFLSVLIGDSRRLFANQMSAKADAYFHSGYYPTIFDTPKKEEESHLSGKQAGESKDESDHDDHADETNHVEHAEHQHSETCGHNEQVKSEDGFLGPPKDWIDRFSREFFPSRHSHLESGGEREILPWLRLSAELDPQRIETYTVAAYWLRKRLGKASEAEQFLRDGLRANPDSYELYFQLGEVFAESRSDAARARNLWEIALRKWQAQEKAALKPNELSYQQIVGNLAKLEEKEGK
ncbi:MAG: hypothetical protein ABIP71_00830, partial [Verrucomicrobiota bacterium]